MRLEEDEKTVTSLYKDLKHLGVTDMALVEELLTPIRT